MRWRPIALALLCVPGAAFADDVGNRITSYEAEVQQLSSDLLKPLPGTATQPQQLVDGIVAYNLGDYPTAAVILLPLASAQSADRETALYYLAETLYRQGDYGGARSYFTQIVDAKNIGGKRYQPALLRLVEIAIAQGESAEQAIQLIDQISPSQRLPNVSYVKAKAAFAAERYDEALADLAEVPKGSDLEMQVAYYTATVYVAKKDLSRAAEIFTDLIARRPRNTSERRVIELGQMALGRIEYEHEQFSKAINTYLLIDRHSDLFPDALYEVSWVYVKNKQYDKALNALELLAHSDAQSTKTPTVRILEGNLHMRKAQRLRAALIEGSFDNDPTNPGVEYDKASKMFDELHAQYAPSYASLAALVDNNIDPAQFVAQLADRATPIFRTQQPIPEAAVQLLREQPDVHRVVTVETDLGDIQRDLDATSSTIDRLEGVLATNDHTNLYPVLNNRRTRIIQVEDDLIHVRNDLADQLEGIAPPPAELASARHALATQYASLGNAEQAYVDRRAAERVAYDKLDAEAGEIDGALASAQGAAVAIRKYGIDTPSVAPETKATATTRLESEAKEAETIESELAAIRKEIDLGRDLAGVGDVQIVQARTLRRQLMLAQDAELRAMGGGSTGRAQELAALAARASRVIDQLRITEDAIDKKVEEGVVQVRTQLATEKANLAAYRNELTEYEAESKNVSSLMLTSAFREAKAQVYDILIRADVGAIDTSWSQKSDTDDDLKRLNLSRAREMKQLKDEFRDILDANVPKSTTKKPISDLPAANTGAPTTSPDKGGSTRVTPTGKSPTAAPPPPPVKPDAPKKGGSK